MIPEQTSAVTTLESRTPAITGREIVDELVPPRQFRAATFDSYRPDPEYPSQAEAVETLRAFSTAGEASTSHGFFKRHKKKTDVLPGVYLDGGFGVGKTHLLAALWHAASGKKYFGTFMEYTALVGALGYAQAVALLKGATLVAIDEFELDDPGDTMMMTRLLSDLVASGSRIAATSNTPPNSLGEGRFAAQDFLREIQALAGTFNTIRIDGVDYRRRDVEDHAQVMGEGEYDRAVEAAAEQGMTVTSDRFGALIQHLATVHPSKYIKLLSGVDVIGLKEASVLSDQSEALRFVAFVDRVYDAQIPVLSTGLPLDEVFSAEMLQGGYRKKYLRAKSRLVALTATEA